MIIGRVAQADIAAGAIIVLYRYVKSHQPFQFLLADTFLTWP